MAEWTEKASFRLGKCNPKGKDHTPYDRCVHQRKSDRGRAGWERICHSFATMASLPEDLSRMHLSGTAAPPQSTITLRTWMHVANENYEANGEVFNIEINGFRVWSDKVPRGSTWPARAVHIDHDWTSSELDGGPDVLRGATFDYVFFVGPPEKFGERKRGYPATPEQWGDPPKHVVDDVVRVVTKWISVRPDVVDARYYERWGDEQSIGIILRWNSPLPWTTCADDPPEGKKVPD